VWDKCPNVKMTRNWEIRDQKNDQNSRINDQMTVLVAHCGPLFTWPQLVIFSLVIYSKCHVVINLVINVVIYLVIDSKYMTKLMTNKQAINDQNKYDQFWSCKQWPKISDQWSPNQKWSFICRFWSFFWSLISHFVLMSA